MRDVILKQPFFYKLLKFFVLVSISSTSYAQKICMKVLFGSFFQLRFGFGAKICTKNARVNVDEIDTCCQFLQYFMSSFTFDFISLKKYELILYSYISFDKHFRKVSYRKVAHKLLVKLIL